MEIKIFDNYNDLCVAVADEIIGLVRKKHDAILGLATGSTPVGVYRELVKDFQAGFTSYKNVTTFNLDEYVGLGSNWEKSYRSYMDNNLFNHIDINPDCIFIPNGYNANPDLECEAYEKKINRHQIDLQLLGIGSNGHIGFNEPGTAFDSVTHLVRLDKKTRSDNSRFFNSLDEVPLLAITMGIKNILKSKKIILMASGTGKQNAVFRMIQGPVDNSCPASFLREHSDTWVYLDKDAAGKLE